MSAEEAVANGVRWMNENLGRDWPEFIDRKKFDIEHAKRCVLGQTFVGHYWSASGIFTWDWIVDHGFNSYGDRSDLQREWEKYLDEYELATA